MHNNAERMSQRKWGVFNHYLDYNQANPERPHNLGLGKIPWSDLVDRFDVERLAYHLHKMKAGYYFITLMQGSKYMLSPNATFDKIAGTASGEACSKRDLPLDLYEALKKYDIDLGLYFTGDGPYKTEGINEKFGFADRSIPVSDEFVKKWASVLEEYAVRYGDKVKYWWVDGTYKSIGYDDRLISYYHDAIKKGNPLAASAFNNGTLMDFAKYYSDAEFSAGEKNYFFGYPEEKYDEGALAHILAPLGYDEGRTIWYDWGQPGCKHTREYMLKYIKCFNSVGGAVSVDIMVDAEGGFDPEQEALLRWVGERL